MKVLSLLLRNALVDPLIRLLVHASMKVLSLLLRNCLVDVASRADRHASMKVLSLLLRNVEIIGILWVITRLNESPELIAQESQCSSTRPSYTAWPQ